MLRRRMAALDYDFAEAESLSWTGYIYGGLAHSSTIQYSEKSELTGEGSCRRGLVRMGLTPEWVKGKRVLETGTGDDHVAHQAHQIIEPLEIDAYEVGGSREWHIVWTLDRMVRRAAGDQTGLG